jgi:Holliday junction resolvase RusA-like endonuclease
MLITVHGVPAPQGSKKNVGRGIMIESSNKVKPWREAVLFATLEAFPMALRKDPILCRGPVSLEIVFSLPKPKSAKRFAMPDKKPDLDKLQRSTFDALKSAGVFEDDSRVVCVNAKKRYAGDVNAMAVPGAMIFVEKFTA